MIRGLNHYNLRSSSEMIETLKNFYIDIVGLELGTRPPFESKGYWLYAGGKDVLHLSTTKGDIKNPANVDSTFDHVAFTAENKNKFIETLNQRQIDFYFREVPEIGTEQIFFNDPAGNGIELIFSN
jgi:catechol-2,3-dioxygenase